MSFGPAHDPIPGDPLSCDAIEQVIVPRARDLGGFSVRRALPAAGRQMVGPFIFFDQMGPAEFLLGQGIDVRPHPHIGLSTVTYLFDGEIVHRDSLGTELAIRPGALNLMSAGRGIVHSERTSPEERAKGPRLFGIQAGNLVWVAGSTQAPARTAMVAADSSCVIDAVRLTGISSPVFVRSSTSKPCRRPGPPKRSPPCTTRWPTASAASPSSAAASCLSSAPPPAPRSC